MGQIIRIPVVAAPDGSVFAAAPSYVMVPGSFLPVVANVSSNNGPLAGIMLANPGLANATIQAIVPDEDCTGAALDPNKIRSRYPAHWLVAGHVIPGT